MTPTERLLFDAFCSLGFKPASNMGRDHVGFHRGLFVDLYAQVTFHRFRVDFVLSSRINEEDEGIEPPFKLIVEVDGPEHDSRAYRRSDRERDRIFALFGCTVIRFTNAEVEADPIACASEIMQFVTERQRPYFEAALRRYVIKRLGLKKPEGQE